VISLSSVGEYFTLKRPKKVETDPRNERKKSEN